MPTIAVTGFKGIPASFGGVENKCEHIYSRLAAKGFTIIVYARIPYVQRGIEEYKGIKIVALPTINTKYGEAIVHTFLSVLHIIKSNPDIVHIYSQGPCLFSPLIRLFRPRIKIFFSCVGLDWQRRKWPLWASKIIRLGEICSAGFPHHHITVSKELKDYYLATYGVETDFIPNGVERAVAREPDLIKEFDLRGKDYFLSVGRIVPEKRVEDIIRAYLMKKRKAKLVIVGGSSSTKDYVKSLEKTAGQEQRIIFTGYRYGDYLLELYSNALAFVTASELEGMPNTLLEALSHGLPCIASDIGPHREVLQCGNLDRLLFPVGRLEELSQFMDEVETMPDEQLEDFKQRAIESTACYFSWDTVAERTGQLYLSSLAS